MRIVPAVVLGASFAGVVPTCALEGCEVGDVTDAANFCCDVAAALDQRTFRDVSFDSPGVEDGTADEDGAADASATDEDGATTDADTDD